MWKKDLTTTKGGNKLQLLRDKEKSKLIHVSRAFSCQRIPTRKR